MTTDRLFVIMLVILVPMTGCFGAIDNADAEEKQSGNTPPVIFSDSGYSYAAGYTVYNNSISFAVAAMAMDFDGFIAEFGVDFDLDGKVDFDFNAEDDNPQYETVGGDYYERFDLTLYNEGEDGRNYCSQWAALIAVDDDGLIDVRPFKIYTELEWNDSVPSCSFQPYNMWE